MNILKKFKSYCKPAQLYAILSLVSIVGILLQNKNPNTYCCGAYSANIPFNNMFIFFTKLVYVGLWTYILHKLCKNGYSSLSWALVLLPFVSMFVFIGLLLLYLGANIL